MPFHDEADFWNHMDTNRNRVYKFRCNIGKLWRKIWGPKKSDIDEKLKQIKAEQAD